MKRDRLKKQRPFLHATVYAPEKRNADRWVKQYYVALKRTRAVNRIEISILEFTFGRNWDLVHGRLYRRLTNGHRNYYGHANSARSQKITTRRGVENEIALLRFR